MTLDTADTAAKTAGVYAWTAMATNSEGERQTILTGSSWLRPNPGVAYVSFAAEALQLVRAQILNRLPQGLNAHTVNGVQISKMTLKEAREMERDLAAQVAAENVALNPGSIVGGAIQIEFTR